MPSIEPEELPRRRSRGELLEHIYTEGARRRRRRRIGGVGLSVIALVVLAGSVLAIDLPGGTPQHVATRGQTAPPSPGSTTSIALSSNQSAAVTTVPGPGPGSAVSVTTTTFRATSSAATGGTSGSNVGSTTTVQPVTTLASATTDPPTTVTTQVCRNSSDSACGPFHWEPDPGPNQPLVIEVTATPRAADPRTFDFAIVYTDGDAPIADACRGVGFGDNSPGTYTGSTGACPVASCLAAYGAWSPPVAQAGRAEATVAHTFGGAGTYDVQLTAQARHSLCHDPYSSYGSKTLTVVVP